MYTLGIDVHKDESQVAVLDADDEVDREVRVDNANLDALAEEYEGCDAAIEATGNYFTIYDTLDEYLDVVVADPYRTKALGVVEAKNDRLDAKLLAQLRSAGMIAQSPTRGDQRAPCTRARPETVGGKTDPVQKRSPCSLGPARNLLRLGPV